MTPKQKIIDAIRKVCPETMELSFGCLVYSDWRHGKRVRHHVVGVEREKVSVVENRFGGTVRNLSAKTVHPSDVTIIGHPLRFEHLLRAIFAKIETDVQTSTQRAEYAQTFDVRLSFQVYDLTLSLEDNLDNPELVTLLSEVLDIE